MKLIIVSIILYIPHSSKRGKKTVLPPKLSRRYTTSEEAADAKNVELIERIKKMDLKVVKKNNALL